ncbi:MAG: hypothetical protein QM775_13965 [Pirellulales bacterium]
MVGSRYSSVYTPPAGGATTPVAKMPAAQAPIAATMPAPSAAVAAASTTPNPTSTTSNATSGSGHLGSRYSSVSVGDRYASLPSSQPAAAPTTVAPSPAAAPPKPATPAPTTNVATAPAGATATTSNNSTVGSRYAPTSVGDRYAALPSSNTNVAVAPVAPNPGIAVSPPAMNVAANPNAVTAPSVAPTTKPVASAPVAVAPPAVAMTTPAKTPSLENSKPLGGPAQPSTTAQQKPAGQSVAAQPIELPAGSPPLALDGYCPVTVTDKMIWKPGSAQFGAIHRGRTYLFLSAAEQQKFLADPEKYSPIISGNDPVAYLEQGQFVCGDRNFGMFCGGQMILFSSSQNYEKFKRDQQRYTLGLQQAMQAGGTMRR